MTTDAGAGGAVDASLRWRKRTLAVIGLGQIGGSLAMAAGGEVGRILGCDRRETVLNHWREQGVIAAGRTEVGPWLAGADAVLVAVPVSQIEEVLAGVARHARPGCLVSDTGSVKEPVMAAATVLPDEVPFVGGHPMAGTEATGVAAADPQLVAGCVYVLTPHRRWPAAPAPWRTLFTRLGAEVQTMAAADHDNHVAVTSHLPLAVAVALTAQAAAEAAELPQMGRLIAGSFRDSTRVASGSIPVGADMLLLNRERVLQQISGLSRQLDRIAGCLERQERQRLTAILRESQAFRDGLYAGHDKMTRGD